MKKIDYGCKCLLIKEKKKRILVAGDIHIGLGESFGISGIDIEEQIKKENMAEFNEVFEKVGKVDFVVLLGDLKHDFRKGDYKERAKIREFFNYLSDFCDKIILIRGNHDNYLARIVAAENYEVLDYFVFGEFCFLHGDKDFLEIRDRKIKYWIMGHGHPAIKLMDGIKTEKYKCYLEGYYGKKKVIIVPSFSGIREGSDPREKRLKMAWNFDFGKFEVKIVDEKLNVLNFGKLEDIK